MPTAAMRAGDFSGASFTFRDPLTGQPFPNKVIPANRLDPSAQKIMDIFYPLPNAGNLSNGYGRFRQFVPVTRKRHRADLRIDHELSAKDQLFIRGSYQYRDPAGVYFEAGNLTNLPIIDSKLDTAAVIGDDRTRAAAQLANGMVVRVRGRSDDNVNGVAERVEVENEIRATIQLTPSTVNNRILKRIP